MMILAALAASLLLQDGSRRLSLPSSTGRLSGRDKVIQREREFFSDWADAWRASESARAKRLAQPEFATDNWAQVGRGADLYCQFTSTKPLPDWPDGAYGREPMDRKIDSRKSHHHWVCPNWLPPTRASLMPADERVNIDNALEPDQRARIKRARQAVIASLRSEWRMQPEDSVIVGQLVRFLIDDQDFDGALRTTSSCEASRQWCRALLGYTHHRAGNVAAADAAFASSDRDVDPKIRCVETDLVVVFDGATRDAINALPCAQRDSLRDVVWWLADPLWSTHGNDRRSEQYARRVAIALHAATDRDERYNWLPDAGGDALRTMVLRYGWPAYTYMGTGAAYVDFGPTPPPMYGYSQLYQPAPKTKPVATPWTRARTLGGFKTTYEYPIGRLQIIPSWSMTSSPFEIRHDTWAFNGPGGGGDKTYDWWPDEHYAPMHPLVAIADQQTAFLRRDNDVLLAYSTNLGQADLDRRLGDSVTGRLMIARTPKTIQEVGEHRVASNDRLTFLAPVAEGKSLISAEIPWDSAGRRGARARFGIDAPATLSTMVAGTYAISEPVLLVVPPDMRELPTLADSAIALMRGTTTMAASTNSIGIYWETYGFSATDSVEIAISVQRHSGNVLSRIVTAAGLTGDANALVSTSWKEPQPGHTARTIAGRIPIQMRAVSLAIGGLTLPGEYTLQISAQRPGAAAVTSKRDFVLK